MCAWLIRCQVSKKSIVLVDLKGGREIRPHLLAMTALEVTSVLISRSQTARLVRVYDLVHVPPQDTLIIVLMII